MIEANAIRLLQEEAVNEKLANILSSAINGRALIAVPSTHKIEDLQRFLPNARRMVGLMETSSLSGFTKYVASESVPGNDNARVFVNKNDMSAKAVLNYEAGASAGHCDHNAILTMQRTAAYTEWLRLTNKGEIKQREMAEFIEDYFDEIKCEKTGGLEISRPLAIAAIRNVKIDGTSKAVAKVEALSEEKSLLEQVTAEQDNMPHFIRFNTPAYLDLPAMVFSARLGISIDGSLAFRLNAIRPEIDQEKIAQQMVEEIEGSLKRAGVTVPIVLGNFTREPSTISRRN